MGIRRLMSDLVPYATDVVLGHSQGTTNEGHNVEFVIVDGPSLVYFVYNRLLTYRSLEAGTGTARLPTYREVGKAYIFLLSEFETHGVIL